MTTTQINTAELTGAALDWAVARIMKPANLFCLNRVGDGAATRGNLPHYCTDWAQGGPLIDQYGIEFISEDDGFEATAWNDKRTIGCIGWGKDHLAAACRAIIVKELGETVSVPTELVEGGV